MGCCSSNNNIQELNYEKLISHVFSSIPISKHSGQYCLSQFLTCEKEISRKTVNQVSKEKNNIIREYSEDKYYQVLEFLYNMKNNYSDLSQITDKQKKSSVMLLPRKTEVKKKQFNRFASGELKINLELVDKSEFYLNKPINKIYYSITPDYNSLFDSIIKNKPKSSFIIYILSFSNDEMSKKAELFMELFQSSELKCTLTSFQSLIQSYALLNLNFSYSLLEVIQMNNKLVNEISKEFNIRISNLDIEQWQECNNQLVKRKFEIANKFALLITRELMMILVNNVSFKDLESNPEKPRRNSIDNLSIIDTCDQILKNNGLSLTCDDIITLNMMHPYLFNANMLRKVLFEIQ